MRLSQNLCMMGANSLSEQYSNRLEDLKTVDEIDYPCGEG